MVQVKAKPFGAIIDRVREQLAFLGKPKIKQKEHNNTIVYNILFEDDVPIKLKIEVNTREHFSVYGLKDIPVKLDSEWDSGEALVLTYGLDELLATKLRALYQRKKGRDQLRKRERYHAKSFIFTIGSSFLGLQTPMWLLFY